jgi:hypothetical protein
VLVCPRFLLVCKNTYLYDALARLVNHAELVSSVGWRGRHSQSLLFRLGYVWVYRYTILVFLILIVKLLKRFKSVKHPLFH